MNNKPLRRIPSKAAIGGVAAGLADYFGMDIALMRVILAVLFIFTKGAMLLAYIILWVALPEDNSYVTPTNFADSSSSYGATNKPFTNGFNNNRGIEIVGYILLIIGGFMLFDKLFYWIHLKKFIPAIVLIGVGIFLIFFKNRHLDSNNSSSPTTPPVTDTDRATPSWTDDAPITKWEPEDKKDDTTPNL